MATMPTTGTAKDGKAQTVDKDAIRPFTVNVPEAELTELRQRIIATRYPERETVTDDTQGVQLATILDEHGRVQRPSLSGIQGRLYQ